MKSNSLQRSPIVVRFRGVMDITSASHAEGSEFDPHQSLKFFSKNVTTILKYSKWLLACYWFYSVTG